MPVTEIRTLLKNFLNECDECQKHFLENVEMITDDSGILTDDQAAAVLVMMNDFHQEHATDDL